MHDIKYIRNNFDTFKKQISLRNNITNISSGDKALDKLCHGRDRLDTLKDYYDGSSLFNKQQQLND